VLAGDGITLLDPSSEGVFFGHREQRHFDGLTHVQVEGALRFVDFANGLRRTLQHRDAIDHLESGSLR